MEKQIADIRMAVRLCWAFMGLALLTFFAINLVQAHQTGAGLGIDDGKTMTIEQGRHYVESVGPRP